jgi:hypothetical protein
MMKPYALGGRARTGGEQGGMIFHAVEEGEYGGAEYSHATALCGVQPGRRSIGWSTWHPEGQGVTCPKCLRKMAAQEPVTA